MDSTPFSLLERLRQPEAQDAWDRFVRLYTPLLYHFARRTGLQEADAADLVQEVFALLLDKLPKFQHDGTGSFRNWLRTVTLNKWRERARRATLPMAGRDNVLAGLSKPDPLEEYWEEEYRRSLVREALHLMQVEFRQTTWRACWEHVVEGKSAEQVGQQLGLTPGAVRAATFRVISRLRRELTGLVE